MRLARAVFRPRHAQCALLRVEAHALKGAGAPNRRRDAAGESSAPPSRFMLALCFGRVKGRMTLGVVYKIMCIAARNLQCASRSLSGLALARQLGLINISKYILPSIASPLGVAKPCHSCHKGVQLFAYYHSQVNLLRAPSQPTSPHRALAVEVS